MTLTAILSRRVKSTSGGRRKGKFHADTTRPKRSCQTTRELIYGRTALLSRNPAKNITPPLWETIKSHAYRVHRRMERRNRPDAPKTPEHRIAEVLGKVQLRPYYWSKETKENLTENMDGEDAARLYLFFDLSALNQSGVARAINDPDIQESLGIKTSVSQPTLNRMPGRMDDETQYYCASDTETVVRRLQDTNLEHWFRDPTPDPIVTERRCIRIALNPAMIESVAPPAAFSRSKRDHIWTSPLVRISG